MGYVPNFVTEVTEKKEIQYGCCHPLGEGMAQKAPRVCGDKWVENYTALYLPYYFNI